MEEMIYKRIQEIHGHYEEGMTTKEEMFMHLLDLVEESYHHGMAAGMNVRPVKEVK